MQNRKKLISIVLFIHLSFFISTSNAIPVYAHSSITESNIVTRAEETKWYYRTYGGKVQKRLWSITYGYWKTAWMYI